MFHTLKKACFVYQRTFSFSFWAFISTFCWFWVINFNNCWSEYLEFIILITMLVKCLCIFFPLPFFFLHSHTTWLCDSEVWMLRAVWHLIKVCLVRVKRFHFAQCTWSRFRHSNFQILNVKILDFITWCRGYLPIWPGVSSLRPTDRESILLASEY